MRLLALVIASGALTLTVFGVAPQAAAVDVTCPDGFVAHAEATPTGFQYTIICAGHMSINPSPPSSPPANPEAATTPPAGTWVYDGPVCDNAGICASNLLCSDGTPMLRYVFVATDGTRGDVRIVCPGDPDDPGPTVSPPTPGEILSAFKEVGLPKAELSIQPPGGQTLVNFETIFSTKADPFTTDKIDLVPGYKVQFDIYPTAFTWKFGDGTELTTDSAGEPWAPGKDVSEPSTTSTRPSTPSRRQ